ncbi:MAG: pentapeptide repeat-containing protein [Filomicrobium sp.]
MILFTCVACSRRFPSTHGWLCTWIFRYIRLADARFTRGNLTRLRLAGCVLAGSRLVGARLTSTRLVNPRFPRGRRSPFSSPRRRLHWCLAAQTELFRRRFAVRAGLCGPWFSSLRTSRHERPSADEISWKVAPWVGALENLNRLFLLSLF